MKLFRPRNLAVIFDVHAFRVVDDHGEVAFLGQNRRDIQDWPKEDERQHAEGDGAKYDQSNGVFVARNIPVGVISARGSRKHEQDEPARRA